MALIILLTVPHLVHLGAGVVGHHSQPEPDDVPVPVEVHAIAVGARGRRGPVLTPHPEINDILLNTFNISKCNAECFH